MVQWAMWHWGDHDDSYIMPHDIPVLFKKLKNLRIPLSAWSLIHHYFPYIATVAISI